MWCRLVWVTPLKEQSDTPLKTGRKNVKSLITQPPPRIVGFCLNFSRWVHHRSSEGKELLKSISSQIQYDGRRQNCARIATAAAPSPKVHKMLDPKLSFKTWLSHFAHLYPNSTGTKNQSLASVFDPDCFWNTPVSKWSNLATYLKSETSIGA